MLALLQVLAIPAAQAEIDLIARHSVPGSLSDLSGLAGPLESGVPGNLLGGYGSSIAYTGAGNLFVVVPDRGPNANPYNPLVDDTTSYINRFHTMELRLTPAPRGSALPYGLSAVLKSTTLLSSPTPLAYGTGALGTDAARTLASGVPQLNSINNTFYFTARTDGFDPGRPSTYPGNARFDPEGVRVSNDGKRLFISDEYGPYVYQFDRATGRRIKSFVLPDYYGVGTQSASGEKEVSSNTSGRIANRGMEGLAITPDGSKLVGLMQNPLLQDGGRKDVRNRIVAIDIATGALEEYVYLLASSQNVASEIVAINDHEFLVDERDQREGTEAAFKKIFRIDLSSATRVTGMERLPADLTPAAKTLFLDLLDPRYRLAGKDFPQKIEGLAFGPDIVMNGRTRHTLYVTSDNDFLAEQPSHFYVFAIDANDLKGYEPQKFTGQVR